MGIELPDLGAARAHCMRLVRVTFGETVKGEGRIVPHHRIDIEDEQGTILDSVRLADAVRLEE